MAKLYIIALEEHYLDPELKQLGGRVDRIGPPGLIERLDDLGALRLREMDDSGIDFQVLSHSIPGLQNIDAATGVSLARRVNDRLDAAVRAHPTRFAAFAALPTADPRGAADELERTVTKLGFKGAMINGMTRRAVSRRRALLAGYERAAARRYSISPGDPHPAVVGPNTRLCQHRTVTRRLELMSRRRRKASLCLEQRVRRPSSLKSSLGHMGEDCHLSLAHKLRIARQHERRRRPSARCSAAISGSRERFFSNPALVCAIRDGHRSYLVFGRLSVQTTAGEMAGNPAAFTDDTEKLLNSSSPPAQTLGYSARNGRGTNATSRVASALQAQ